MSKIKRNVNNYLSKPDKGKHSGKSKLYSFAKNALLYIVSIMGFILLLIALDKSSIREIKNAIAKNGGTVIEIEHVDRKKSPFKNTTKGDNIHKVKYINSKGENKVIYIKNGDVRGIDW